MRKTTIYIFLFINLIACDAVDPFGNEDTSGSATSCSEFGPVPLSRNIKIKRDKVNLLSSLNRKSSSKIFVKEKSDLIAMIDLKCRKEKGLNLEKNKMFQIQDDNYKSIDAQKMKSSLYTIKMKNSIRLELNEFKKIIKQDDCVLHVEEEQIGELHLTPNDSDFSISDHFNFLEAEVAWDTFYHVTTGINQTIQIAIIDTGGELTHSDLSGTLWTNPDEINLNALDDDGNGVADDINGANFTINSGDPSPVGPSTNNHGTNVAGLAAASFNNGTGSTGVMGQNIEVMHLNVVGTNSGPSLAATNNAITYAINEGAEVINLSLGFAGLPAANLATLEAAIQSAIDNNVFITASVGNEGALLTESSSAPGTIAYRFDGLMSTTALNSSDGSLWYLSNFSSSFVEIGSPGSETDTQGLYLPDVGNSYTRRGGTSAASPILAGSAALVIALMRSRGASPTAAEVETFIKSNSETNGAFASAIEGCRVLNLRALSSQF